MADNLFTWDDVERIRQYPHLLGHLAGKTLLTDIHSAWILYIWDTLENHSLMGHRGSYKTTAITTIGPLWWLLFHPNDRIGLMRKSFSEMWSLAEAIINYLRMPEVAALFEFVHGRIPKVKKKNSTAGRITFNFKETITPEGSLNVFGIDTGITGTHVDKFLCDDVVTLKDKNSAAERKKTRDVIREIQSNILDPGKEFAMIGTPWHKDDAWDVVPKPLMFDYTTTNILTKEDILKKKKLTTKKMFAINYELKHIASDEAIFKDPLTEKWDFMCQNIVAHLDAKYSGDCTGALTIKGTRKDGITQINGRIFEEHVDEVIDEIVERIQKYKAAVLYMEMNADKGYLAKIFQEKFHKKEMRTIVKSYTEKQNKHVKVVSYLKPVFSDIVWASDKDTDVFLSQVLDYEENEKPDDAADSASSLLRESGVQFSTLLGMSMK